MSAVDNTKKYHGLPSMCIHALAYMDEYLASNMSVFEWGPGGSTVFLGRRVAELYSIEHNTEWFTKIKASIDYWKLDIDLKLVEPQQGEGGYYGSKQPTFDNLDFTQYVTIIDKFPDSYFDMISVDGRSRPACLHHSLSKIKIGGLLLLDDANRKRYAKSVDSINALGWPSQDFIGRVPYLKALDQVVTKIWIKTD